MEGRLVKTTVMRLAERDGLDAQAKARLEESIALMERLFDGLGFCLSEEGDLLSQWRGYADDAKGVAIGFNHEYLTALQQDREKDSPRFSIYQAQYDIDKHDADVAPTYRELRRLIDEGAFKRKGSWSLLDSRTPDEIAADDKKIETSYRALVIKLLELFPKLYELKAPAFREEREWRLVSIFTDSIDEQCQFRASRGRVIPYRSFVLKDLGLPPISEVILGPKHETPPKVLQSLLKRAGYSDVIVRRSEASYR